VRNAFASELLAAAREDPRVVLLSGDIGNRLFDPFKAAFPGRFVNCGVAEQNMAGVAAGMASCGLRPVVYTIASFATLRCLEQIRVDVCYHRLGVVIAGVGAGLSYASLGPTHHALEDVACLRSLPGMCVLCPGDPLEARAALRAALRREGPCYLRLGKKGEKAVHPSAPDFAIGRGLRLRAGSRACLIASGTTLPDCAEAARVLEERGVSAGLVSLHTVKPLDEALLEEVFSECDLAATVEEHGLAGGAGSAVAEWLCGRPGRRARLLRIGGPDAFFDEAGGTRHARARLGLDPAGIAASVLAALEGT
jgi:transketolase